MDSAKGTEAQTEYLVSRMLLINFAALHTTTIVRFPVFWPNAKGITHLLFDIAAHSEYIDPIREEIQSVVSVEGWGSKAMAKLYKLDSIIKESFRVHCSACISSLSFSYLSWNRPEGNEKIHIFKWSNGWTRWNRWNKYCGTPYGRKPLQKCPWIWWIPFQSNAWWKWRECEAILHEYEPWIPYVWTWKTCMVISTHGWELLTIVRGDSMQSIRSKLSFL